MGLKQYFDPDNPRYWRAEITTYNDEFGSFDPDDRQFADRDARLARLKADAQAHEKLQAGRREGGQSTAAKKRRKVEKEWRDVEEFKAKLRRRAADSEVLSRRPTDEDAAREHLKKKNPRKRWKPGQLDDEARKLVGRIRRERTRQRN